MINRFTNIYYIRVLRAMVTKFKDWESKLGTDEQYYLPNLMYVVALPDNTSIPLSFFRRWDNMESDAFKNLYKKDEKAGRRAEETYRRQHMQRYDSRAYEALLLREEVEALREEVANIKAQ